MHSMHTTQTNLLDYLDRQYSETNKDCDPKSNTELRKVWEDTLWCFSRQGPYKKYSPARSEVIWKCKSDPEPLYSETVISVNNLRSLEMAEVFVKSGYHPLVLNMASNFKPGGGVRKGSRAQEEDLFRKTNYFQTLDERFLPKKTYPLKGVTMIYSSEVTVIKDTFYDYLDVPYQVDFIACPAIRNPQVARSVSGATMAPVAAARPTDMAMVAIATLVTFIPMRFATSRSWAVERMARPRRVLSRRKRTPTRITNANPRASRC